MHYMGNWLNRLNAGNITAVLTRRIQGAQGFSIAELVTVAAITGVLSTVGIASYRSQQMKAQAAEAKHSLISLYSFQQEFKNTWNTYHGNLVLVGAVPVGIRMYDVGFTDDTTGAGMTLSTPEGLTALYAEVEECSTWAEICDNGSTGCGQKAGALGLKNNYFSCTVNNGTDKLLKDDKHKSGAKATYNATATTFKAVALGELNRADEWSINEKQELSRVQNGEN